MDVYYTPEARAELISVYAGMAMQALIARKDVAETSVSKEALLHALDLIEEIEAYHNEVNNQDEIDSLFADERLI